MDINEYIKSNTKLGIQLTRRLPSLKKSKSSFGGIPTLPSFLDWPCFKDYDARLPFICQIDLRDLPDIGNSPLPKDGVLFYFAGNSSKTDELEHRILFAPDSSLVPSVEAMVPSNLKPLGSYEIISPTPFNYFECHSLYINREFPPEDPIFCYPKFELDMKVVNTIFPDYPNTGFDDDALGILGKAIDSANYRYPRKNEIDYGTIGLPVASGGVFDDWCSSSTNWPWAWIVVELIIRRNFRKESTYFPVNQISNQEIKNKHYQEAHNWLTLSIEKGRFHPISEEQGDQFRRWLYGLYLSYWRDKGYSDQHIHDIATNRLPTELATECLAITNASVALLLDARQPNRSILPDAVVHAYSTQLSSVKSHQILGFGVDSQNPPPGHYENVLLLQVSSDWGMLMQWGDCDSLQFSISEHDLREKRFDRAYCWISG